MFDGTQDADAVVEDWNAQAAQAASDAEALAKSGRTLRQQRAKEMEQALIEEARLSNAQIGTLAAEAPRPAPRATAPSAGEALGAPAVKFALFVGVVLVVLAVYLMRHRRVEK